MKLLDGEVRVRDLLSVDADSKKGVMTFAPAAASQFPAAMRARSPRARGVE
jgi:hypothetical protein